MFGPPCGPFTRLSSKRKREDYHPFKSDSRTGAFIDGARCVRSLTQQICLELQSRLNAVCVKVGI